jgi:hypothetical protein
LLIVALETSRGATASVMMEKRNADAMDVFVRSSEEKDEL